MSPKIHIITVLGWLDSSAGWATANGKRYRRMVYRRAKREESAVLSPKPTTVPRSSTSNLVAQRRPGTQTQSLVFRSEVWRQLILEDNGVGLYSKRFIS